MNTTGPTASDAPFPYSGPHELRLPIEDALRRVVDPEVAMSIVDVGLVCGVKATYERVDVEMTMTSAACPVADLIIGDVEAELDRVVPSRMTIHVDLVWDPAWTADRMSQRAKALLGW